MACGLHLNKAVKRGGVGHDCSDRTVILSYYIYI